MFVSSAFPVRAFVRTPVQRPTGPALSGRWVDGAYELTADLPGVADSAVGVAVAGRTLTIDVATDDVTWSERIRLPHTLDPEQVVARYVNGRLTITVGRTAEPSPRSIAIDTTTASPRQIEGADAVEAVAAPEDSSG